MSDFLELRKTIKVGRKTLNVTPVEELACLEKVRVALLPLPFLHYVLFLVFNLVTTNNLAIAIVNQAMRIPEVGLYLLSSGIVEVEEDGGFASKT
jgi:hypothetical protein